MGRRWVLVVLGVCSGRIGIHEVEGECVGP